MTHRQISTSAWPYLLAVVLASFSGPKPVLAAVPSLVLEADGVVLEGLTPQSRVALFGFIRHVEHFAARNLRDEAVLVDEDGDGRLLFEAAHDPGDLAIWGAIDLSTGQLLRVTSAGLEDRERVPTVVVQRGEPGERDLLRDRRQALEILLVRPGVGAYRLSAVDGGPEDEEPGERGLLGLALASARPLEPGGAPLEGLAPGDVLFGIDPRELTFFHLRLGS